MCSAGNGGGFELGARAVGAVGGLSWWAVGGEQCHVPAAALIVTYTRLPSEEDLTGVVEWRSEKSIRAFT